MTTQEINSALIRIAHEIIENNKPCRNIVLVGLLIRGAPLAQRLVLLIHDIEGIPIPVGSLDFRNFRNDINNDANPANNYLKNNCSFPITGKVVVLVDDVLSTRKSIRAGMAALVHIGRPKYIQLAVLLDRGHREIPIRAEYVVKIFQVPRQQEYELN